MVLMLDTNVVLDRLCRRAPFYDAASRVFSVGIFGDAQLFISSNMLTDILYILQKDVGGLAAQQTLLQNLSYLNICAVSADDCLWSLRQGWNDFEDCLVSRCASNIKADFILTRDVAGFEHARVPALTPPEFLAKLQEEQGLSYAELEV